MESRIAKYILKLSDYFNGTDDTSINSELRALEEWIAEYIWDENFLSVAEIKDKLELVAYGEKIDNLRSFYLGKLFAIIEFIDFFNVPISIEKLAKGITDLEKRVILFISHEEEVCPSQITHELNLSKQHTSNILRQLKEKELINVNIVGKMRWYSLSSSGANVVQFLGRNSVKMDQVLQGSDVIQDQATLILSEIAGVLDQRIKKYSGELKKEISRSVGDLTSNINDLFDRKINQSISTAVVLNRSVLHFRRSHNKKDFERESIYFDEFDNNYECFDLPLQQSIVENRTLDWGGEILTAKLNNYRLQQQVNSLIEAKSGVLRGRISHEISWLKLFDKDLVNDEKSPEEYTVEFLPTYGGVRI